MNQPEEASDEWTGEEIIKRMNPEARAKAENELSQIEPGPEEPFRVGDEEPHTELDEDPISEGGASRKSRL